MRATVTLLNGRDRYAFAVTANNIRIGFALPADNSISPADELEVDLERLDVEQEVGNLTKGTRTWLTIKERDVQDLTLPSVRGEHGPPSVERRRGG
jgi:hypothetical protein